MGSATPKLLKLNSGIDLTYSNPPKSNLEAAFELPILPYPTGAAPTSSNLVETPSLGKFKDKTAVVVVRNKNNSMPQVMALRLPAGVLSKATLQWSESAADASGKKYQVATLSFDQNTTPFKMSGNFIHQIMFTYASKPSESEFANHLSSTFGAALSDPVPDTGNSKIHNKNED